MIRFTSTHGLALCLSLGLALVAGCDDGGGSDSDAGRDGVDSGTSAMDSGGSTADGGASADSGGAMADSGGATDSGPTGSDAARADGAAPGRDASRPRRDGAVPVCSSDFGKPCAGAGDCGADFSCSGGGDGARFCLPTVSGSEGCGGFAGTLCSPKAMRSECLFYTSADFGPCLTPEELTCVCSDRERAVNFACPDA